MKIWVTEKNIRWMYLNGFFLRRQDLESIIEEFKQGIWTYRGRPITYRN